MIRRLFIGFLAINNLLAARENFIQKTELCTKCVKKKKPIEQTVYKNNIPSRLQWNENAGYCGEVSFICANLYYGQYLSQYDARAIACQGAPQNSSQLLLGKNDLYAASEMHLNALTWGSDRPMNTDQFLAWVKENILKGYPVAIGVYTNEYLFYGDTDPSAGDAVYDHIVPAMGIGSNHSLTDYQYYGDDTLYFSDNGLWGTSSNPPYNFNDSFSSFQANRKQANARNGVPYSLSKDTSNYGIAFTGVMDLGGDTLPVSLTTDLNYEEPEIIDGSNERPAPMPITLEITLSKLEPNVLYNLYRYDNFESVPDSQFNAHAKSASKFWRVKINSGTTYTLKEQISSDQIAIYRAVKANAP